MRELGGGCERISGLRWGSLVQIPNGRGRKEGVTPEQILVIVSVQYYRGVIFRAS